MGLVRHWDEAETHRFDEAHLGNEYEDLGSLAGSVEVGVGRWRPFPGRQMTPAHVEGGEEEIHFILSGSGWSWQDGATYEVRGGDALVHLIDGEPHTLVAGDEGMEVLAFGERASRGAHTWLPRAGVLRIQDTWVETPGGLHPYERENAAGRVELGEPQARPSRIVNVDEVEPKLGIHGRLGTVHRDLGRAAGSTRTGLTHIVVDPGKESAPPHAHSAEEELFVVLAGSGEAVVADERAPVRAGSVLAMPAGTGRAHHFVAGPDGLTVLAYGQRDPRDTIWYPRSRKLAIRAFGLRVRVGESLDYWDGEP
jgi:uncharacterized cupin superfamily protein